MELSKLMTNFPKRKSTRLKGYDYSSKGAYFITICTKGRKKLLSKIIVGTGVRYCPKNILTNSLIAKFISTFKRFCNKEYGENIWQARSDDHIIRGEKDYRKIWEYIDTNVIRWEKDCFYNE